MFLIVHCWAKNLKSLYTYLYKTTNIYLQKTQAGSASEKLRSLPDPDLGSGTDPGLTEDTVLTYLRDNPDLLQQLGRLQLPPEADVKSEKQILPPSDTPCVN